MKKLFLILFLFSSGIALSQNGYNQTPEHYRLVKETTSNMNEVAVRDLADKFVNSMDNKYSYLSTTTRSNSITLIYSLDKEIVERTKKPDPTENIILEFSKGYNLSEIQGVFDDLVQIWLANFVITGDKTNVVNNYQYRDFIFEPLNIDFKLEERKGIWIIKNYK